MGEHRGVGVLLLERMEDVHGLEHGARDVGIVFVETDHVAFDRAAVAGGPLLDVAHGAETGEVGARHEVRAPFLLDQIGVGEGRGVVVVGVVSHDHREGALERGRHDVGAAGELAAAQVHRLVHGAALEEVVALVRAAAGVEEREHAGDQQRRFVVRDGVGTCEDRGGLAVFAVRVGEEQRLCGCETLVQPAAFADEAAFDDRAVVDDRPFGGDQVVGLDVHADARAVAERRVFEDRGAVDFVADADLADEARPDDAAVASHLADLRRAFLGVGVDHFFECGDGLRAVAVNGHDVGDLCRQTVEYLHRAAAAFVHRGHADAVAEGRAAAAFEGRDAFYERAGSDAVVRHARADDAGLRGYFYISFQVALQQLKGFEILRDQHLRPIFGRIAECFECGGLRGG